jgi:hypothetical protein
MRAAYWQSDVADEFFEVLIPSVRTVTHLEHLTDSSTPLQHSLHISKPAELANANTQNANTEAK